MSLPQTECCVATTLRVHSLAKELGVPSKAVIEKCRAEGIELKNHMAAISIGLAESIREWFSTDDDVTSIEVADAVDVERARQERRRTQRRRGEGADGDASDAGEAGAATATTEYAEPEDQQAPAEAAAPGAPDSDETSVLPTEAPAPAAETPDETAQPAEEAATTPLTSAAATPPTIEPEAPAEATAPAAAGAEEAAPTAAPAEEAAVEQAPAETPAAPDAGEEAAAEPLKPAAEHPPEAPPAAAEPLAPAGPQVVPKPAELQGPKVVRIEQPEPTRTPRPRPRPAARGVGPAAAPPPATAAPRRGRKGRRGAEDEHGRATKSPRRHSPANEVDQRVREWRDQDLIERKERLASVTGHGLRNRRAAERRRQATGSSGPSTAARKDPVAITAPLLIKDFCAAIGIPFAAISKKLLEHTGQMRTINQMIDAEQAEIVAMDLGVQLEIKHAKTAYEELEETFANRERKQLKPRPPAVAMLGHVDHGKTSLLDAIRSANVHEGEAGGITQHIGAYRIRRGDWDVTFIDTPGHRAFTEMRARGANLTDVVVLVVAADDGVMPQTEEAIAHAKAAGVAIVIALNKIDLPGVDLNRVYAKLAEHDLTPTEWGGNTDLIKTSATTGEGVDELIAHLSTLSELLELKADPTIPARATVIEAQMREGRGVVAQVLVREGTLKPGQHVVCGPGAGRTRALRDHKGKTIKEASPGTPVEVSGLDALPQSGDTLYVVDSAAQAKAIAEEVRQQRREAELQTAAPKPKTLETLLSGESDTEIPELNVIVKADVQGSVEVLRQSMADLPDDKARLKILHAAVGAVSEADVHLAKASNAIVLGFHVVAEDRARQLADQLGVEVRTYQVIYELLEDLTKALAGLLAPVESEEMRGSVEVRQVFNVSRVGTIAGCLVSDGIVRRNHRVRLVRDGRVIVEGRGIGSLKRFKDDVREVRAGLECGIKIEGFDDVKPGDVIQAYEVVEVAQEL
jgi:translation initiation factor IF-2